MVASSAEPALDSLFTVATNANNGRRVNPLSQKIENSFDSFWVCLQMLQHRIQSRTETCLASLTLKPLNIIGSTTNTTANKGVNPTVAF